jgi:hypothetical protein
LIAIDDVAQRDQVATAAASFEDVIVEAQDGNGGRDAVRRRRYDFGVIVLRSGREPDNPINDVRSYAPDLQLIGLTPRSTLSLRREEKTRLNLFALLGTPLDTVELYRTLRRVIERIRKPDSTPVSSRRE